MGEVNDAISEHVDSHHLGLTGGELSKVFKEHQLLVDNSRKLDMLVDDYFGAVKVGIDGEKTRIGGMKERTEERWIYTECTLNRLNEKLDNGGVPARVKLTKGQMIALVAAVVPMLVASLNAIFIH